jgi:hypothetical protein
MKMNLNIEIDTDNISDRELIEELVDSLKQLGIKHSEEDTE